MSFALAELEMRGVFVLGCHSLLPLTASHKGERRQCTSPDRLSVDLWMTSGEAGRPCHTPRSAGPCGRAPTGVRLRGPWTVDRGPWTHPVGFELAPAGPGGPGASSASSDLGFTTPCWAHASPGFHYGQLDIRGFQPRAECRFYQLQNVNSDGSARAALLRSSRRCLNRPLITATSPCNRSSSQPRSTPPAVLSSCPPAPASSTASSSSCAASTSSMASRRSSLRQSTRRHYGQSRATSKITPTTCLP